MLVEIIVGGGLLLVAVVWPPIDPPARADAVVLLSGDGARLPGALRLMEQRIARTLVFVGQPDTVAVEDLCRKAQPFEVVCLRPTPDNTRNEARVTGQLAHERSWETMVVVTSKYHALRARMLFGRCFDGTVDAVGDAPGYGGGFARRQIAHEWLALVHATLLARGC